MTKKEKKIEKRKKTIDKTTGVICRIDKDTRISADPYQFILTNNGRQTFHATISSVLDELLECKEKEFMVTSRRKDLLSIKESIENAHEWLENIVKPLLKHR